MQWNKLLSDRRIHQEERPGELKKDLRSAFEKDYHRIIVSASFRRLQDKTQVFPLDRSDFIRTRLTHSLEVSSVGRSLAQNIGVSIAEDELDGSFSKQAQRDICDILQCAGLIHDIGNPPFGHFGEESIREWFAKNLDELKFKGRPVREFLNDQQYQDLLHFEGNAQGLRMVTRLDYPAKNYGMNLSCGLLSAMIKYPTASTNASASSRDLKMRKTGYFFSEEEIFDIIREETGTKDARNPLAFILEAADDIAYATADIEDAFKKGFFSYSTLTYELQLRGVSKPCREKLDAYYDMARMSGLMAPEEYAVRTWLRDMQDLLIVSATVGFVSNYDLIMEGSYPKDIFEGRASVGLLKVLKEIAYDYAFTSMSIFKTEIAANRVLTCLMDILVPSALVYDTDSPPGLMEEKYLSLIPDNYRQVYHSRTKGRRAEECVYDRILLATDTISGMTDSYASDLYKQLTAI